MVIQAKNESSTKSCIYRNHIYLPLFHYTDIAIVIMEYEIIVNIIIKIMK